MKRNRIEMMVPVLAAVLLAGPVSQTWGVLAEGGTVTHYVQNDTEYRVHSFTNTGTAELKVVAGGAIDILVVGGGGGGGSNMGGGGGAGGFIYHEGFSVEPGVFKIAVGGGGAGAPAGTDQQRGNSGGSSVFGHLMAKGGGGGASDHDSNVSPAADGGSGGGASGQNANAGKGALDQGNPGANSKGHWYPGGGGGAGGPGQVAPAHGGPGLVCAILGRSLYFAGGGGGSGYTGDGGNGGIGGGGGGAIGTTTGGVGLNNGAPGGGGGRNLQANTPGGNAGANTGGGGGGGAHYDRNNKGGDGGSGIVVVRYRTGIACDQASDVTATAATLRGRLGRFAGLPVEVTVYWGDRDGGVTGKWAHSHTWPKDQWKEGSVLEWPVKDLQPDRTYHYTFRAVTDKRDHTAQPSASFITGAVQIEKHSDASETGLTPGAFTVRRPRSARESSLTVHYTVSGTAGNGTDYHELSGLLTIPAGSDSAQLTVTPILDYLVEPTETVTVTLAEGPYIIGKPEQASLALADNGTLLFSPTAEPTMPFDAAVLCGVLQSRFNGSAEEFQAFHGVAGAYDCLADQVRRSMLSTNMAVVARAVAYGAPFTPYANGLRATYFEGASHENAILKRRDSAIRIEAGNFPHPGGRQQNVSALWSGFLAIPKAGDYRFHVAMEGGAFRLSVANRVLMLHEGGDAWSSYATLEPGLYPFHATFRQGTAGVSRCTLTWEAPGFGHTSLGGGSLRVPLTVEEALAVANTIPALGGADADADAAARKVLHDDDPASRTFLINALYNLPVAQVRAAVDLLAYRMEPSLAEHLLAVLEKRPELRTDGTVMDGLVQSIWNVPGKALSVLAGALEEAGSDVRMDAVAAVLCAALQVRCNQDRVAFGMLTGDPETGDRLEAYVARALASPDPEVLARACRYGAPFVSTPMGWQVRYYEGRPPLRLVRESRAWVAKVDNSYPLPEGSTGEVSAIWSGILTVPSTNQYIMRCFGRDHGRLWLDGGMVLDSYHNEPTMTLTNAKGAHVVRVDFGRSGGDTYLHTHWEGQGLNRQDIAGWWVASPLTTNELATLKQGLDALGNPATASEASAVFVGTDDGRRAYLRFALRYRPAAVAAPALEMLTTMRDAPTAALIVEQLEAGGASLPDATLLAALERIAVHLDDTACAWLAGRTKVEDTPGNRPWLAVLYAILERKCDGQAEAFAKLTGQADAYAALAKLAGEMLSSTDPETVDWACEHVGPFAPFIVGCRGRFYDGRAFGRLLAEQLSPSPRFDNGQFPHTAQTDVSASWHGRLWVEQPGEYTFYVRSDDGQRLWVNGKLVVDAWMNLAGQERLGRITLDKGWHEIDAAMWQGVDQGFADLNWEGPGLGRQRLDGRMQVHPWPDLLAELRKHVQNLDSADAAAVEQAKKVIADHGDLGKLFLRNAAQHETVVVK